MSSSQHLVPPKLPTILVNETHVDLPGYDIWLNHINGVLVVPTVLDVSKFEDALSRALQLYPHAAGQLQCCDGRWSIELTNTAVPVDVDHKSDMSSDSHLHGDWVIQDDLSLLLNQQPIGANLVNGSAPLLRLKLTLFNCETCIGVCWNHSLGDGIMLFRFMHTLSQFYQGLPPEFALPTFEKHDFDTPSHFMVAEPSSCMTYYFNKVAHTDPRKDLERVRWRIDNHDLKVLCSALSSNRQNRKLLSRHDCLTAYLVTVFNCNRINSVQRVITTCSYRHVSASFFTENLASNLILDVSTNVPMDMAGIATAVRNAIIQGREPSNIYNLMALRSQLMLEAANSRKQIPFPFDSDELMVNSWAVMDWCSAHFGSPDGTRFHTSGVFKHCLRYFRSNPAKGDDGKWQARQSIDISMGVPAELKQKILETLARGVQHVLDNHVH